MKQKKTDWAWNKRAEKRLERQLSVLTQAVRRIVKTKKTTQEIITAISAITENPAWIAVAYRAAAQMVGDLERINAKTWRKAAAQAFNSRAIYEELSHNLNSNPFFRSQIEKNAAIIKSLPDLVSRQVTKSVSLRAIKGERAESLESSIQALAPDLSANHVRLIARTETAKTQAAITETRAVGLNRTFYIWRTSQDQRVRSSHAHMEGVVCEFTSPPSPEQLNGDPSVGYYNPGNIYNCRCYAEPVLSTDQVTGPIKLVKNGQIVKMGKKEFLNYVLQQSGKPLRSLD
jgi:SPP1 gp7 family putative phage head morphogenesis protein